MGLLSRAGDLVYTFRFLKMLVTPFDETEAFKLGIIDADGIRVKETKLDSTTKKSAYTYFVKLVFNIKKLLAKVPGGSSKLGTYAAALYLVKERFQLTDDSVLRIVEACGYEPLDFLTEVNTWYVLNDGMMCPGIYKIKEAKILNSTGEELVEAKDKIIVEPHCYPKGEMLGLSIYEVKHQKTGQLIYITSSEVIS
jgi:hypothetical protein|tara:strand:- start:1203 stop:1790 length:588 start_codon:yes stop_codon:yes gene_type:complete